MSNEVRVVTSKRGLEFWDEFVSCQPDASFCHLSAWKAIIEEAYGLPCYFLSCDKGDALCGVLPLVQVRGVLAPNRLVSVPFLDQGGILASDPGSATALMEASSALVREVGARGIDLRTTNPREDADPGGTRRFRFVIGLPASLESLWKSLGPKVRNQIRKAEKSGLTTSLVKADQTPLFYRVFSRNMRDLGSPTHSEKFFRLMAESLGDRFSLYLTSTNTGEVVAGAIAIRFRSTVSVPWASSLHSARSMCPNHSFYWEILQQAVRSEATKFDFGRSTEGSGTYSFKKQWSTELLPLGWEFFNPAGEVERDYLLDSNRNPILSRGWRSLPLLAATAVGPWIRRQLPN